VRRRDEKEKPPRPSGYQRPLAPRPEKLPPEERLEPEEPLELEDEPE
jgi:hypothetical protein